MSIHIILIFLKKKKNPLREDERQPSKKIPNVFSISISNFFAAKESLKKDDV
jgi:hypothetical protein